TPYIVRNYEVCYLKLEMVDHQDNITKTPPLNEMYLSSIAKESGHETKIFDANIGNLSKEETLEKLKDYEADVVVCSSDIFNILSNLDWLKYIKNNIDIISVISGKSVYFYPKEIIDKEYIDYGILGSKKSFGKLLKTLDEKTNNLKLIKGICYKNSKSYEINWPDEKDLCSLSDLPWPDRDNVDNSKYSLPHYRESGYTQILKSDGCIHNCNFCDMPNFKYDERSAKDVFDEVKNCVEKYNIRKIDFIDRDFLINKKRARKLCRKIIKDDLNIEWVCLTRTDKVDEKTLKLMKEAGCWLIWYGFESGNQKVLDNLNKNISIEQGIKAVRETKKCGIKAGGFFIIGNPGEGKGEIKDTIDYSKKLDLDYAHYYKMTGKPGSKLYERIKEKNYDYYMKMITEESMDFDMD
ncbi:MAG: radical SAM protein, partial [Candidatus Aenigmatarchaeota archaeon]